MEVWDLYDENKNITGKYCIRGNEISDNLYHLVVHVWIKNSKGEYLISQRSENRPKFPLKWECVGGSVLKGETSLHGAIRETELNDARYDTIKKLKDKLQQEKLPLDFTDCFVKKAEVELNKILGRE